MSTNINPNMVSVVALFFGTSKPSAHVLMGRVAQELQVMLVSGFASHKVVLKYIAGDLPAIALIRGYF
jgi:hypothetical protein